MFTITKENYVAGRNVFWTWWAFFQELDQNIISIGQNIYFIWIYDVIGIKVQIPIPTYYRRKFQGQFYEISPFVISLQLSSLSLSSISYFQYIHILSISLPMIWINMDIMTLEKVLKSHPIVISLRLGNAILPSCILHLGIAICISICGESYEISPLLFLFNLAAAYSQVINPSLFDCSLQRWLKDLIFWETFQHTS